MSLVTDHRTITAESAPAVQAAVREAIDAGLPLIDYGPAHEGLGHPPPRRHLRLEQDGHVIEHHERDLTVLVAAGARLGAVQAALRQSGQFLPIDADADMTIGEIITCNVWGPLRVGFGGISDLLLGLAYVDDEAALIRVEPRTAQGGVSLARLFIGSLGELGVPVEAMLRTFAMPPTVLAVDLSVDDPAHIDAILPRWLTSDAQPARLAIGIEGGTWVARVGYLGRQTACLAQLRALERLLDESTGLHIAGTGSLTLPQYLTQREAHRVWRRQLPALVKLIVPPADTGSVCTLVQQWTSDNVPLMLGAEPAHGIVWVGGRISATLAAELDMAIRRITEPLGGIHAWYARPGGATFDPFWPPPNDLALLRRVKHAMDPRGRFNPGRLIPVGDA